jgi:carbohydrate-selective porin OprB
MLRGLRSGFGKLAIISGVALILVILALPTFALPGDQPATVDPAVAADPQPSTSPTAAPKPVGPAFFHQDYMYNWGPGRQRWADHGFSFSAFYITDALGDPTSPAGTREGFHNWQRVRATVDIDFGKFSSAKGLLFHVTGVWQNGVNMGGFIGSIANPSGLVSSHQFRMDSMFLQQSLMTGKVVLTGGIMAAQDFYGLQEYGGAFLTEPLDYNFGNQGNTRMSYDPESGPAVELKLVPNKHFYVKTGYFLPSDDGEKHVYPTGFNYKNGYDGATSDSEVAYFTDPGAPASRKSYPGIIKAGFVYNGGRNFTDYGTLIDGTPKSVNDNYSFYVQANQPIYRVAAGSNRGLDATFGVSTGPQNKSKVPTEFTAGLIFNAPFAGRSKDSLAFGMVYSKLGSDWKTDCTAGAIACNPTWLSDEKEFEFNYKAMIAPWLLFQPVYQYYANVGGRNNGSASIAGLRLMTTF